MDGGTYTLVLDRERQDSLEVGALGQRTLSAGWYAYTGSALGSGGFSRVERHRAVADGENGTRHWHVDYLLGDAATTLDSVVTTPADIECAVAERLLALTDAHVVAAFGCSDCGCRSHLVGHESRETLCRAVERAHAAAVDR